MEQLGQGTDAVKTAQEILGYLNFSSGASIPGSCETSIAFSR